MRIFRPRDKNQSCVHWVDCYKNAEWAVEFDSAEGSYFEFYCDKHLKDLKKPEEEVYNFRVDPPVKYKVKK